MEPTSLLIDQGNSQLKWALIKNEQFRFIASGQCKSLVAFQHQLAGEAPILSSISKVWISSVAKQAQQTQLLELLADYPLKTHLAKTPLISQNPHLINGYDNPAQLGIDRWLALLACGHCYGYPCVLVDAGSALTLDYVDHTGHHHGGWILPGLAKSIQSLTAHTRLSETDLSHQNYTMDFEVTELKMGTDTTQGIQAGLLAGAVGAIDQFLQQAIQTQDNATPSFPNANAINKIICGGEAPFIQPLLSGKWRYEKDLVLKGLALYAQSNQPAKSN